MADRCKCLKFEVVVVIVLIVQCIAIGLLGIQIFGENDDKSEFDMVTQDTYTIYIGLNHKDTGEQVMTMEEAKKVVTEICCKYVDGLTLYDGSGVWQDDEGGTVFENTLICIIYTEPEKGGEKIAALSDEIIDTLHQDCVLIEYSERSCTYYSGSQQASSQLLQSSISSMIC